jgi:guanylate kinase
MILDILGGGGSGKTTLKFALLRMRAMFTGFVPYTTRPKRPDETDGVHYYFVSTEVFQTHSTFVLKREADGWLYGVDRNDLEQKTDGKVLVVTFDIDGIKALEAMHKKVKVIYLNIPEPERIRRMLTRGDKPATVMRRIDIDRNMLLHLNFFSPILEVGDDDLNEIIRKVLRFID